MRIEVELRVEPRSELEGVVDAPLLSERELHRSESDEQSHGSVDRLLEQEQLGVRVCSFPEHCRGAVEVVEGLEGLIRFVGGSPRLSQSASAGSFFERAAHVFR